MKVKSPRPTAFRPQPPANCSRTAAYRVSQHSAFCFLPIAHCLLPTAFCPLPAGGTPDAAA